MDLGLAGLNATTESTFNKELTVPTLTFAITVVT